MEACGEGAQVIDALAKHPTRLRNGITLVFGADDEPDPARRRSLAFRPLPTGGETMGFYAFPEEGTRVVVYFAFGLPNKPYLQTSLPTARRCRRQRAAQDPRSGDRARGSSPGQPRAVPKPHAGG